MKGDAGRKGRKREGESAGCTLHSLRVTYSWGERRWRGKDFFIDPLCPSLSPRHPPRLSPWLSRALSQREPTVHVKAYAFRVMYHGEGIHARTVAVNVQSGVPRCACTSVFVIKRDANWRQSAVVPPGQLACLCQHPSLSNTFFPFNVSLLPICLHLPTPLAAEPALDICISGQPGFIDPSLNTRISHHCAYNSRDSLCN